MALILILIIFVAIIGVEMVKDWGIFKQDAGSDEEMTRGIYLLLFLFWVVLALAAGKCVLNFLIRLFHCKNIYITIAISVHWVLT